VKIGEKIRKICVARLYGNKSQVHIDPGTEEFAHLKFRVGDQGGVVGVGIGLWEKIGRQRFGGRKGTKLKMAGLSLIFHSGEKASREEGGRVIIAQNANIIVRVTSTRGSRELLLTGEEGRQSRATQGRGTAKCLQFEQISFGKSKRRMHNRRIFIHSRSS